ncbi:MAG: hypothetical protein LAP40_19990 [Acidobacteriia bacterium]|nr:hypothetical protein [Terriglobia bacterium]
MLRRIMTVSAGLGLLALGLAGSAFAQEPAREGQVRREPAGPPRPPLFFREQWKQAPDGGEHAVAPSNVANANLELKLYGDGKDMQATGTDTNESNPTHVWTGLCTSTCAAALRDKDNYVDLTGLAKIRWLTKVSGFHQVHPMIKLADGTWLVGDRADGSTVDWHESEFSISEVRWLKLDVDKQVTKGNFVAKPDLSKVDEVGFTDLMPGSGHGPGGWSDVAFIEVYGKPVKR